MQPLTTEEMPKTRCTNCQRRRWRAQRPAWKRSGWDDHHIYCARCLRWAPQPGQPEGVCTTCGDDDWAKRPDGTFVCVTCLVMAQKQRTGGISTTGMPPCKQCGRDETVYDTTQFSFMTCLVCGAQR